MDARDDLWPENAEAWNLFHRVCSRFTNEFQMVPVLVQKVIADLEPEDAIELAERRTLIYDTVGPPTPKKS
jgi:hypothetical protein